jgi:hypothetical protein
MKYIISLATILAIIISCNTGNKKSNLLAKPGDMKADEYVINIDRDTTIETKNGALLKIPKGSLKIDNGNTVTLEIKEAYSISQMIQAGLTTQANGDPLSSGGMIYINAKAGQNVTITQAIKVAVPADYLSNNMQLFKGDKDADGNINWKDPAVLPENKQLESVDKGQVLFQSKCASCHMIGKDATGPNLAHVLKRAMSLAGKEINYPVYPNYITTTESDSRIAISKNEHAPGIFFHYGRSDASEWYTCNLIKMYGNIGPEFNDLTFTDLEAILKYIQNESDKKDLPLPSHAWLWDCADSCAIYKKTIFDLTEKKEAAKSKKKNLIEENGPLVDKKPDSTWGTTNILPPDYDQKVSPKNYDAEYYQFTIESFGWYNIDMMLKGVDGVEESELFVRIVGQYREKIKVFLIIPSVKVYGEGGPAERNADEFAFFYKNGKLPLPQNAEAYILAVTETEESIAFALKKFNTTTKQELEISLNQSTKEEFTAAINNLNAGRLHIKVADSKNANEIRKTNTEIKNIDEELKNAENLKPKGCDCDCGFPKTTQTVAPIENSIK